MSHFTFFGNAVGAAGTGFYTSTGRNAFPVKAASSLPVIGGLSKSRSRLFGIPDVIHFWKVRTTAEGIYDPQTKLNTTTVTASTKQVCVKENTFKGSRLYASLKSVHPRAGDGEIPIIPTVSYDFKLFGHPVEVATHDWLVSARTKNEITKGMNSKRQEELVPLVHEMENGYYSYSLVSEIRWKDGEGDKRVRFSGNVIQIHDFGEIHLAEVIRRESYCRLVSTRIKLIDGYSFPESKDPVAAYAPIFKDDQIEGEDKEIVLGEVQSNGIDPGPQGG